MCSTLHTLCSIDGKMCSTDCEDIQCIKTTYILKFFIKFYKNGDIQKLKAWYFQMGNNYFCILNVERARALQTLNVWLFVAFKFTIIL